MIPGTRVDAISQVEFPLNIQEVEENSQIEPKQAFIRFKGKV